MIIIVLFGVIRLWKPIHRIRKRTKETKKHTGRRCLWSHKTGYEIRKIHKKRNKKYKNGISDCMFRIQFQEISQLPHKKREGKGISKLK